MLPGILTGANVVGYGPIPQRGRLYYDGQFATGDFRMAKNHSTGFLDLVNAAKERVRECTCSDVRQWQTEGREFHLVDVREESEWAQARLPGAIYLGKGVIERDAERVIPDHAVEIVLYCGGGFRSALAADALQQMGYTNVVSMDGGIGGWHALGFPLVAD
ncbi:MAG: rhodanese-like domain-containing protein [Planctomycetaceae bacterium]